ncbi:MAG: ATP-binding cassette domain-containing protein [Pseudorhodobacter sp.]|nr:ATP-binding cassette domain-containing protein [Pseudorhodobacter sp.]
MLRLDHLTLTHPGFSLTADWSASAGQKLAIIGPSGAGKSSLLMAIAGFITPQSGSIIWGGRVLDSLSPAQRPVSILFQDQNLFPHLTLVQNLGLALSPRLRLGAAQRTQVDQVLDRLGLAGMGMRRPGELSGGQQGRAALGRVLLQNRPVLLLDEPFAALGPALKADLLDLVSELTAESNALTLLVSHDPADAQRFANQTVLVVDGQAMPPVDTPSLFANPPKALADYLG